MEWAPACKGHGLAYAQPPQSRRLVIRPTQYAVPYDEELAFAQALNDHLEEGEKVIHKDSNGAVLSAGDNVVLIKDLKVKGSSMVAKQGTVVRKIALDPENAQYIEGKVEGQQIVILTQYVKKTT